MLGDLKLERLQTEVSPKAAVILHCQSCSVTGSVSLPQQLIFFLIVCALHGVLLWWVTSPLASSPPHIEPPSVIGVLVSQAPVSEPKPLPMASPEPLKQKAPVRSNPAPVPIPKAPPSERATTAPPQPPGPASPMDAEAAPTPTPAGPPAHQITEAQAVIPPRADAALLNNPTPVYPAMSRRLQEQGRVLFDVYILRDGSVGEIKLKRSSGYTRLDEAALQAVRQWRYVPAKRGDEPIPYWYVQPINFTLNL